MPSSPAQMHDSGERDTFTTGAVRDSATEKPRIDLISPHANRREGEWLRIGAVKYDERNWEKGIPISRCIASIHRHLAAYQLGEADEDHMAAIRTNAGFILHFEEEIAAGRLSTSLDDMPRYATKPTPRWGEGCGVRFDACLDAPFVAVTDPALRQVVSEHDPAKPTVYIAGPMRGIPEYNFPAFHAAAEKWIDLGYNVISPADLDLLAGAVDPASAAFHSGTANLSAEHVRSFIRRDTEAIQLLIPDRGDAVLFLPGSSRSIGAAGEFALARWLGVATRSASSGRRIQTLQELD